MVLYLPMYNAHFFRTEKGPKIEMHIIHGILCFRLAALITMYTNTRDFVHTESFAFNSKVKGRTNEEVRILIHLK